MRGSISSSLKESCYTFDDLGNALRKIWIDLGVRIEIDGLDRLEKRFKVRPTPATPAPYRVGRIRHKDADDPDGKFEDCKDGWLLYIKSGLHGTEPMDVLSYAMSHPTFPHETTTDQFFSESQFESYRMLGFEIASRAFEAAVCPGPDNAAPGEDAAPGQADAARLTLEEVVKRLNARLRAANDERGRPQQGNPHHPCSSTARRMPGSLRPRLTPNSVCRAPGSPRYRQPLRVP